MDGFIFLGNIKGDKGDKGDPGTGLTILGYYATETELTSAITNPTVGDAYGVGSAHPYDIYVYTHNKGWVNNGPLQTEHTHSVNDIEGTIPVSKGGTGATSPASAANNIQTKSIGSGTTINEKDDLNSYKTVGNYVCPMTATALTLSNCPVTSAFNMVVGYANGTTSYLYQELTHFLTGVKYYRAYTASEKVWNDWKVTYSSHNKPTPSEIGAAPSGHGLGEHSIIDANTTYKDFMHKGCGFYQPGVLNESPHGTEKWTGLLQIVRGKDKGEETGSQLAFFDFEPNKPRMWLRTLLMGTTGPWVEMIHSGNIANYAIPGVGELERLRADVDYIAVMTGVEL